MSPIAYICTTPDEKADDLEVLASQLSSAGCEVHSGRDMCHPGGHSLMHETLVDGEKVVLVCKRRLEREIFEHELLPGMEFFSYSMEGDPRDLASRIFSDVVLKSSTLVKRSPTLQNVLVLGGGVGGVYAALDIAAQGHSVILVERDPSIGGIMAALDKTFPTMDCSI